MPKVRKICTFGGLAAVKSDRMGLGTLPGVSESPGVGLIGVFFQRFAEKLSVWMHTCVSVCLWIFMHEYACVHVVAGAGVGGMG